MKPIKSFF